MKHHKALEELDGIHPLIDWKPIEQKLSALHAQKQGEAAWPPLLMFKFLLLQSGYGLSDLGLEKQLAHDPMFRRFINLEVSEGVPDHSTVWQFRNTLTQQGLLDALSCKPSKAARARMAKVKTLRTARPVTMLRSLPTARRPAHIGYKAHVNVDEDGFIKAINLYTGQRT